MPPIAVFAALLLLGCAPKATPTAPRAAAVVVRGIEPRGLDFDGVRGELVLELRPAGALTPHAIDWDLVLADAVVLSGRSPTALAAAGRVVAPIEVRWDEVGPALAATGPSDAMPWTLTGSLRAADARGEVVLPLRATGSLPALVPPATALHDLLLNDLDLRNGLAEGELLFTLDSPQELEILRLAHRVWVDDVVAHEGTVLPEPRDDAWALPVTLDLNPLDEAVLDALATRSPVFVRLEATATVRTPFGELPLTLAVEELVPVRDAGPDGFDADRDEVDVELEELDAEPPR